MKEIDLSVLTTTKKDNILQQLLDGTMTVEEAKRYVQNTIEWVTNQKWEQISTILQETNKPYDLSPESVQQFLQNAPEEAKTFFLSNFMSDDEKLKAMNTFRYNASTIDILDEQGNIAFLYGLVDQRYGIAIARPIPEPGSLIQIALAFGLASTSPIRRTFRSHNSCRL